ncbi:PIN domain-like protein [Sistotremastrum suecicum HHB10207 ss-3]|uniref:PIN domain-like protein n=1 Tax=Sistotremastrum suecicum HHB10207 ss-3 TaxID=1314776 RepID=A0A166G173_9AGAM|nr:PIN domain-like protein [Sistotremastrum suecicum HHB10207 ss-3]
MGVKQLWTLVKPVGRPVMLETMEGKALAIDSSIWIYQFQATMRDKDGRALVNAHVLGFLRRICKLLFYGIKPVFVFDGGAPVLKRQTIVERKNKKRGAAATHAKVAEKLLAAHMRREALNAAEKQRAQARAIAAGHDSPNHEVTIDENTVYLEDLVGTEPLPKTPAKEKGKGKAGEGTPTSSAKKNRWHDYDPYKLPNIDDGALSKPTQNALDPRLATEEELQNFINEMKPSDFDVTSPEFRALPTELQYEIIGDLRLKSRQTSYKRLQSMLRSAPTPIDFSKAQIKGLQQRNALTQQLLMTTDSIGKAHLQIPVRIASERNREYVLVKNHGPDGGWVLGIRDDGTAAKPIEIDRESDHGSGKEDDDDEDDDMEEIPIAGAAPFDPDLRAHRQGVALAGIANNASKDRGVRRALEPKPKTKPRKPIPLFVPEEGEETLNQKSASEAEEIDDDAMLELAMQESREEEEARQMRAAIQDSRETNHPSESSAGPSRPIAGSSTSYVLSDDEDDELSFSFPKRPSRLDTALSFANTPKPVPRVGRTLDNSPNEKSPDASLFGRPSLLLQSEPSHDVPPAGIASTSSSTAFAVDEEEDGDMEEVVPSTLTQPVNEREQTPVADMSPPDHTTLNDDNEEDLDMEEVVPQSLEVPDNSQPIPIPFSSTASADSQSAPTKESRVPEDRRSVEAVPPPRETSPEHTLEPEDLSAYTSAEPDLNRPDTEFTLPSRSSSHSPRRPPLNQAEETFSNSNEAGPVKVPTPRNQQESDDEELFSDWARTPSPEPSGDGATKIQAPADNSFDAAEEIDIDAEEGEFARFTSEINGRDVDDVRKEIDEEIRVLNQQKKNAMRDSEDITQQMISQIMLMLRLFGIPYITAPMEAEAQCAELVALGLVEGVITDDSDVFLFGGLRVFKNMFNQSKTVECFLLSDLDRELGLNRDQLIRLAYLLGSDYIEGIPGVGPVVAMELLKEFPGSDGLHKFKDWWKRVQTGRDTTADTASKFRKRFKKKFKELYLSDDWPNPQVRDAYLHPTVDDSEEPFKWGLPDLDALRSFFRDELSWPQSKVDDLLLPIIRKMGQRNQAASANKQGTLEGFFDISVGTGTYAPRKRKAYTSKRLQDVVKTFRKEKSRDSALSRSTTPDGRSDEDAQPKAKRRNTKKKSDSTDGGSSIAKKRKRAAAPTKRKPRKKVASESDGDQDGDVAMEVEATAPLSVELRPRPKPRQRQKTPPVEPIGENDSSE